MNKITNVTKNRKQIINKLHKYSQGSQSLMVMAGVLGQTVICSASVQILNLDGPNVGETLIAGGGGTAGDQPIYLLDSSASSSDALNFAGNSASGGRVFINGANGANIMNIGSGSNGAAIIYYALGESIDGSADNSSVTYGYTFAGAFGGARGDWTVDRPSGAIGFKNGDGEFGFLNVDWDVSTKSLTILGGSYEDSGAAITVTAVPEPAEYAAALGLGALGLAFYRRRPENKTRLKNK